MKTHRHMRKFLEIVGILALLLIGTVLGAGISTGTVYKYRDESGVRHYSDAPPELPEQSEAMGGMIERSDRPIDLQRQLATALEPRNDIETAVCATVAVESTVGFGSGFFINDKGYIITNKHVLQFTEDQERQTDEAFEAAESDMQALETRFRQEAAQLTRTREDLERSKVMIERQPAGPAKNINWSRYLTDFQAYVSWEENFQKRRKQFDEKKRELWEKKVSYMREASVAALARTFVVIAADDTRLDAYLVKRSDTCDLALLKVDGYITPFLEPAGFGDRAVGDPAYAIGNPIKLRNSVASGTLSGVEGDFAKTDAKIYPGNSGGPLVTRDGKVIGVNTYKEITHKFEGLGFAITIERVLAEFGEFL